MYTLFAGTWCHLVKDIYFQVVLNPHLLVTVQRYDGAGRRDLQPMPGLTAVAARLWLCDQILSAWQSAYIYDRRGASTHPHLGPHLSLFGTLTPCAPLP